MQKMHGPEWSEMNCRCQLPTVLEVSTKAGATRVLSYLQADRFVRTGRTLRRRMWWQNCKMKIVIAFAVILLAVIIFLLVCFSGERQWPRARGYSRMPFRQDQAKEVGFAQNLEMSSMLQPGSAFDMFGCFENSCVEWSVDRYCTCICSSSLTPHACDVCVQVATASSK